VNHSKHEHLAPKANRLKEKLISISKKVKSSTSLDHSHFIKILQVKGSLAQPSEPTKAIDLSIYNKKGRQQLEV
jgi:hypothetical protein